MGSWDRDTNGDRDVLERIVALLFALAGLADLAASLPALHRRRVLAVLGYGEAVARTFFIGMAPRAALVEKIFSEEDAPASGDAPGEPGDASQLAARLRALALILAALLARAALYAPPRAAAPHASGREPARPAGRQAQAASPAPDTS
jgi:hypothetical protein